MKTICKSKEEAILAAADDISAVLETKPEAVLALAAGETMTPLFAELGRRCQEGRLSMSACKVFVAAEYVDAPAELTCRHQLETQLLAATDLQAENCVWLEEGNLEQYDVLIAEAGGLDLAVLGIGSNGHIGFNEPATPYSSLTHRQKLTKATKRQKAAIFGSEEAVPDYGLTMGIKTLVEARQILVLAFGPAKAEPVFKMLYARDDSFVPAAFLQIPSEVRVYVDDAAAAKL